MSVTFWQAILLGALQGLTEFLPVSSSAHLILVQRLLPGFSQPGILFDVMLHVGTLVAVVVYFPGEDRRPPARRASRRDAAARRAAWKMALLLAVSVGAHGGADAPAEEVRPRRDGRTSRRIGPRPARTSVLLARGAGRRREARRGGADARGDAPRATRSSSAPSSRFSALFRGLSRSGNTISDGPLRRPLAARRGRVLLPPLGPDDPRRGRSSRTSASTARPGTSSTAGSHLGVYLAGMAVAAVVGYVAVAALLRLVVSMKLQPFIVYCALLGTAVLVAGLL